MKAPISIQLRKYRQRHHIPLLSPVKHYARHATKEDYAEARRLRARNRYRIARGIPLDAPLLSEGRPRIHT